MLGLTLEQATKLLGDRQVEIIWNNTDKLTDYDSQLVVACREQNSKVILTLSNFKLGVK